LSLLTVRVRTDLQQFIKENVGQFRSLASSSEENKFVRPRWLL
jgi:hypothetical protein